MSRFSIYSDPLTTETKAPRRNSLVASVVALFIGVTRELPANLSLLGISFSSTQQTTVGWFIFAVAAYALLHFLASACVEISNWLRPVLQWKYEKAELLKHPAFDESSFEDVLGPPDDHNLDYIRAEAKQHATYQADRVLKVLSIQVYLRLLLELVVPASLGVAALALLANFLVAGLA